MFDHVISLIQTSFNSVFDWFEDILSFEDDKIFAIFVSAFIFYSLYRFILRPIFGGLMSAGSDSVRHRIQEDYVYSPKRKR